MPKECASTHEFTHFLYKNLDSSKLISLQDMLIGKDHAMRRSQLSVRLGNVYVNRGP